MKINIKEQWTTSQYNAIKKVVYTIGSSNSNNKSIKQWLQFVNTANNKKCRISIPSKDIVQFLTTDKSEINYVTDVIEIRAAYTKDHQQGRVPVTPQHLDLVKPPALHAGTVQLHRAPASLPHLIGPAMQEEPAPRGGLEDLAPHHLDPASLDQLGVNQAQLPLNPAPRGDSCSEAASRRQFIGLLKSKIEQGLKGITEGYTIKMLLTGVGYWVKKEEGTGSLIVNVGRGGEPIKIKIPKEIKVEISNVQEGREAYEITGKSYNLESLGRWMGTIRKLRDAKKDKYTHKGFLIKK